MYDLYIYEKTLNIIIYRGYINYRYNYIVFKVKKIVKN